MTTNNSIENVINEMGCICKKTCGTSMNPFLISGRDTVFIVEKNERLKKHDVGLFKINGKYLLHRVKIVHENGYTFSGDNNLFSEKNVPENCVLGVLEGYYVKEKYYSTKTRSYIFKTKLWNFPPVKFCGIICLRVFRKIVSLFKGKNKKDNLDNKETTVS